MNKFDPEIVSLRRDVENEVKRKIKTPSFQRGSRVFIDIICMIVSLFR